MNEPKLKPCPFCGSEVSLGGSDHVGPDDQPYWFVICECGGSVHGDRNKVKAIKRWNRRAGDEQPEGMDN